MSVKGFDGRIGKIHFSSRQATVVPPDETVYINAMFRSLVTMPRFSTSVPVRNVLHLILRSVANSILDPVPGLCD